MSASNSAAPAAAPGKSKKLIVIGAVVALLLVVAAAVGMFLINKSRNAAALEDEMGAPAAAVVVPTFMPLESMVVNLADKGGDRFAQIGITLELADAKTEEQVKQFMPSIRNGILMLVSQRTADELLLREGKEKLAADIQAEVMRPLGGARARPTAEDEEYESPRPRRQAVRRVLFSSFIIQ